MSINSATKFRAKNDIRNLQAPKACLRCCCGNVIEMHLSMPNEWRILSPILDAPTIKFQNGLLKDITYYSLPDKSFKFVIGRKANLTLTSVEFNTLDPNQWLSNFLVEYMCNTFAPSDIQFEILSADRIIENTKCIQFTKPIVLLPLLKDDHWVLFIIDIEKKTFSYLNSLPDSGPYFQQNFFQMFKNHIETYNQTFEVKLPSIDDWEEKRYDIDEQKDSINCGIYVLNNIEQFVKNRTVSKNMKNVDKYRRKMKLQCLKLSDDMTNRCLICGCEAGNNRNDPDVRCKKCDRRLHYRCINISVVSVEYECRLCVNFKILYEKPIN